MSAKMFSTGRYLERALDVNVSKYVNDPERCESVERRTNDCEDLPTCGSAFTVTEVSLNMGNNYDDAIWKPGEIREPRKTSWVLTVKAYLGRWSGGVRMTNVEMNSQKRKKR